MPAKECDNGKWKWGETGACIYDSKEAAEKDNEGYYQNAIADEVDYTMNFTKEQMEELHSKGEIIIDVEGDDGDTMKILFTYAIEEMEDERALEDIDLSVTEGMKEEAQKGLDWRKEFGRGGTEVGVKTAQMILDDEMTIERVIKMYAYLKRHEVDKDAEGFNVGEDGYPSAGRIAWALWGGDAAIRWSENLRDKIEEEKKEEIREEIKEEVKEEKHESFYDTERNTPLTRKVENLWEKNITMEKRYFNIETRTEKREDGSTTITGHAAVFNQLSSDLGGFREVIAPNAFENVLNDDVRALVNHDPNLLLARSTSGTLNLEQTDEGLQYSFDVPDTSYGRDLIISMERGDITQSSFAFTIEEDSWETTADGEIRTINKVKKLYDVSPVTYPAYPSADDLTLAKRSLAIHKEKEENKKQEKDLVQRSLVALKIELKKRK
jgi:HK97 family phage prohead protease